MRVSTNPHIIVAANLPPAVATAALAVSQLHWSATLANPQALLDLALPETTEPHVSAPSDAERDLYVIGNFWPTQVAEWADRFARVFLYDFHPNGGSNKHDLPSNVSYFTDVDRIGCAQWLLKLQPETVAEKYLDTDLVALINVRCHYEGNERVQAFYAGVADLAAFEEVDQLSVFASLFEGKELSLSAVTTQGCVIIAHDRRLAQARVARCSHMNTCQMASVQGTELIEATHAALYAKYQVLKYSVVWHAKGDVMKVSIRAYQDGDARRLCEAAAEGHPHSAELVGKESTARAASLTGPFPDTWLWLLEAAQGKPKTQNK